MRPKAVSANTPEATPPPGVRNYAIEGQTLTAPKAESGLYLVATPIGNLGDITLRALQTLAGVDLIACEDTRITRRLTERYAISTRLISYHEHNAPQARPKILTALAQGHSIALVSDAGTPLISDPGFKLVREACAAGFPVVALPGPSSVLAALSIAGLPTDRFFFEGFLPPKQAARLARLQELALCEATLVLFESGSRMQETLADLAAIMGDRDGAICREMTKLHEEVRRDTLGQLAENASRLETRGEFVLVIAPAAKGGQRMSAEALDDLLRELLARDSVKDAVAHAVEASGRPRREIYARALELAKSAKSKSSHGRN